MRHIIINPAAGRGQSLKILPELTRLLDAAKMPYTVLRTGSPQEARGIAASVCANGSGGIISIGGDGTVQEIVAGMADAFKGRADIPVPLGIIPCGSGNDFILTSNGKKKPPVTEMVEAIKNNQTRAIDLIGASNGDTFINIANIGLDSRIVKNAQSLKRILGSGAYLAAAFKSITQHKNMKLTIEADGKKLDGHYTLIAVCNGQYYGGGMRIAPSAKLDDGEITVALVAAMSRPKTMVIFPSVIFEQHIKLKEVQIFNCKEITVGWSEAGPMSLDGNLYDIKPPVTFKVLPKALKLFHFPLDTRRLTV